MTLYHIKPSRPGCWHAANLADANFSKFAHQNKAINDDMAITEVFDAVEMALKPKRYDLQNQEKLFNFVQQLGIPAARYLQELHELYVITNYEELVSRDTLLHDLFIAGIAFSEAKYLIFQQEIDSLTIDCCLHLVSIFESVHFDAVHYNLTSDANISTIQTRSKKNLSGAKCPGCG